MEAIATVMRRRRLEWFGHVKRRGETENMRWNDIVRRDLKARNIREEWATDGERWKDTVRRELKARNIKEEWATDRKRWKDLCKTSYPEQGDRGER